MKFKATFFMILLFSLTENANSQAVEQNVFAETDYSFQDASGLPSNLLNMSMPEKIKTTGSEYVNESFSEATVNNGSQFFDLRYNNYTGYFEYKKSATETIIIAKEKNKEIQFKDGRKYVLKNIVEKKEQKPTYLLVVGNSSSALKLFKQEIVTYIAYQEALNSYQEQKLPEYKLQKPLYFIEHENTITAVQKSKDIEKMFPAHAKEIKKFIKQKNIDFNSDDLILVQNYLNSIL